MWGEGTDLLERTPPKADKRWSYGELPLQFGELWIPRGISKVRSATQRWPVLIFVHGGWWSSAYGLAYGGFLCEAMRALGVAVWSLEYRRIGDAGGGWPGTMQDVAAGTDYLTKLAEVFPLDLSRVAAAGHSAGGQLAFWLAARHHVPHTSVLAESQPRFGLRGVVGLAAAMNLRQTIDLGGFFRFSHGGPAVRALMGGSPKQVPERYAAADPGMLLPLNVPQALVQGTDDDQIPAELPQRWLQESRRQGDHVELQMVKGAGHFDVVDPRSGAWAASREAMLRMLR